MSEAEQDTKRWYVVHAYSGYEAFVQKALLERVQQHALNDKFGDILIPTEEVMELRSGKKKITERKFFPGYVLVEMMLNDETWHLVRSTPKVLGFIGGKSDKPAPITEKEVDTILQRVQDSTDKPKPKTLFENGEVVRVVDGPFADFNGVVEDVNYEKSRLRVAVLIFGRSTPVELQFDQVQKS
jgi:transcriptional antiterminator NusG